MRYYRTWLPPRVFDEEATLRPEMADPGAWLQAQGDPAHLHSDSAAFWLRRDSAHHQYHTTKWWMDGIFHVSVGTACLMGAV